MVIIKRFTENIIRPIIIVSSLNKNNKPVTYKALIDTGAIHFVWCSSEEDLLKAGFSKTNRSTNITGINDRESLHVPIYTGNLIMSDSGSRKDKNLLAFNDVEVVHSEMLQDNYDMIIPYSFINQFDTFILKPTDERNFIGDKDRASDSQSNIKFGAIAFDTGDEDRNVYSLVNVNSKVVGLKDGDRSKFSILFENMKGDDN